MFLFHEGSVGGCRRKCSSSVSQTLPTSSSTRSSLNAANDSILRLVVSDCARRHAARARAGAAPWRSEPACEKARRSVDPSRASAVADEGVGAFENKRGASEDSAVFEDFVEEHAEASRREEDVEYEREELERERDERVAVDAVYTAKEEADVLRFEKG